VAPFSLTPMDVDAWLEGVAWKHRISWMLVLPPVEPANPNRRVCGSAPARNPLNGQPRRLAGCAIL